MRVKIASCTKNTRTTQGGVIHTGIKVNGEWYNIAGDQRNLYGKEVNLEINGKWAKLVGLPGAPGSGGVAVEGNGKITLEDYVIALREAHRVAQDLEPDQDTTIEGHINRSQARAALVNTMMIALTAARITLPESDEPPPEQEAPF